MPYEVCRWVMSFLLHTCVLRFILVDSKTMFLTSKCNIGGKIVYLPVATYKVKIFGEGTVALCIMSVNGEQKTIE